METKADTLRAELESACANLRRQMDLQQRSQRAVFGGPGDRMAMRALRDRLRQLEEVLANL